MSVWGGLVLILVMAGYAVADEPALVRHVEQGERLLGRGQLDEAIDEYEKALAAGAGSAMFLNRLGTLYLRAARYELAADTFKRSLQERADQLPIYSKLGEVYLAGGELDSAIHYVRAARMIAPQASSIHSSLAFLLLQRGGADLPVARAHLDTALQLAPDNAEANRYLGYYYTQIDSLDQAIAAYVRVTELQPDSFEAYNNLGFLHAAEEDFSRALEYYAMARARVTEPHLAYAINDRMAAARAILEGQLRARFVLVGTRAEALVLHQRLSSGENFGRLAREYSTAPNADAGGDTDFFAPGELLPAFEQAVLQLKVGEISEVLELTMGYFVIQRLN
jgi:tetratricopeptide (TPR) repeat protein